MQQALKACYLAKSHRSRYEIKCLSHLAQSYHSTLSSDLSVLSFYQLVKLDSGALPKLKEDMLSGLSALDICGRIYISEEGINAQISAPTDRIQKLKDFMNSLNLFPNLFYNVSVSPGNEAFEKLKVKIRDQIVADGLPKGSYDLSQQPTYLEPSEFHHAVLESIINKGNHSSSVLLDVRNVYESQIGCFKGSTQIKSLTFRDYLDKMLNLLEVEFDTSSQIYMYCTGGIRCSKAGSILRSKGYNHVQMLKGGITNYGHFVNNNGISSLFIGKNFTFDNRKGEDITEDKISVCIHCGAPCNEYNNCMVPSCNRLFVQCYSCQQKWIACCSDHCKSIAMNPEKLEFHKALGSDANKRLSLFKL